MPGERRELCLHVEDLTLAAAETAGTIPGRVVAAAYQGAASLLTIKPDAAGAPPLKVEHSDRARGRHRGCTRGARRLDHSREAGRMSARLIAVSGLGPKEPAAFVVETEGRRLLLDCGEGPEPGRLPDFDAIGKVDAVILSHSHADHAGGLRFIDRIGRPPVYATAPVLARIAKDIAGQPIPIRGRAEVLGITIQTGANGHAPGGVWLRLAVGEGLIYMGDHSPESQLYTFDVPPPTATMIIDGSYGDAEARLESQRPLLADLRGAGPALFPVPADGRACDIAIFLQEAGFDVAIDDAVRSVATMLTEIARESARPEIMPALETADRAPHARSARTRRRAASWWRTAGRATPALPAR